MSGGKRPSGRERVATSSRSPEELVCEALEHPDATTRVYETVYWLVHARGFSREAVYGALCPLLLRYHAPEQEQQYDALADALDTLIGW